jgi:hypothetical protein
MEEAPPRTFLFSRRRRTRRRRAFEQPKQLEEHVETTDRNDGSDERTAPFGFVGSQPGTVRKLDTWDEKLIYLAEFLEHVPDERFDYLSWVGNEWEGKEDLSCGTSACALGWAITLPEFRNMGLRLRRLPHGMSQTGYVYFEKFGVVEPNVDDSFTGNHTSLSSASEFFNIRYPEAEYLFAPNIRLRKDMPVSPGGDASGADVAWHIRNFVEYKKSQIAILGSV